MTRSRLSAVLVTLAVTMLGPLGVANAQGNAPGDSVRPQVFQAAGPTADSIRGTVNAYRVALGEPNNGNNANNLDPQSGQAIGRREINWDGGGANVSTDTPPVTPFNVFLNTRGAQFTTPGTGLVQGPPSGGPQGGLATLFANPTYGSIFATFSPFRLFTPVGSNITEALFFAPGSSGAVPATVRGFGAVFTDVDQHRKTSSVIEYFGADGELLFKTFVPAAPGDGGLSFLGILFDDPLIAHVRITSGNVAPEPDDQGKDDVVMMDDFLYAEPQPLP